MPANSQVPVFPDSGTNLPTVAPVTERRYILPFVLVTGLFFLWAIVVKLNDILIPHLKRAFGLIRRRSRLQPSEPSPDKHLRSRRGGKWVCLMRCRF
jgi:hypothetical protein